MAEVEKVAAVQKIELQRQTTEYQRDASAKEANLNSLLSAVSLYESRLGLRFVTIDRQIRFIFTQVDAAEPLREFSFALTTAADADQGEYNVFDCQPPVARLPQLLSQLNATTDLNSFVKAMRQEFCQLARA